MKILVIHTVGWGNPNSESGVHRWRLWKPMEELKKHVDWQIDYQESHIKELKKYKDKSEFTNAELEKAAEHLGSYDIVFSSYYANPAAFALCHVVNQRYGTKFVIDDDDDMFSIDPDNPVWNVLSHQDVFGLQRMIRNAPYITTTNEYLARQYRKKSEVDGKVFTIPNFISNHYPECEPNNGDDIVIGYFGGTTHYKDLNNTGVLPAIEKIMHKYKNVRFKSVGVPIDHYLPSKRVEALPTTHAHLWESEVFPNLNLDISIIPLVDTKFARAKSNIKWQESTRMGASVIASDARPYQDLPKGTIVRVENTTDAWFRAIERQILDKQFRKDQVKRAKEELVKNWRLEDHWEAYKNVFEQIMEDK